MRGPFGDSLLDGGAGDSIDALGGPLGVVKAGVFLVAASLVFVGLMVGSEVVISALLAPLPAWLHWLGPPLMVVSVGIVVVGAFIGVLRFMTWRRRTW